MLPLSDPATCSPETGFQVYSAISRYLYALDAEDLRALTSCFAPEVEVVYHKHTDQERRQSGREAVIAEFAANMRKYSVRTHALANFHILSDAEDMQCVSHVVATVVRRSRVIVRGIRYTDQLVHIEGGWRIRRREHCPLWQYESLRRPLEVPSTPLTSMDEDRTGPAVAPSKQEDR